MPITMKKKVSNSAPNRLQELSESEGFHLASLLVPLVIILVLSTVLLVMAAFFLGSFRLQLLGLASGYYVTAPVMMVVSSFLSILVALAGLTALHKKQVTLYIFLSCLTLLVLLLLILATVLTFLLSSTGVTSVNKVNVDAELRSAVSDSGSMSVWASLQSRYKCCGGRGSAGYKAWEVVMTGGYPDSCCTVQYPGCGGQAGGGGAVHERIYVRGCITTIKQVLSDYVIPLLLSWGVIGVIVVIVELLLIVLYLLYARTISNRKGVEVGLQQANRSGQWEEMPLRYTSSVNVNIITNTRK